MVETTEMWEQMCPDTWKPLRPKNPWMEMILRSYGATLLCLGLSIVMLSQQMGGHHWANWKQITHTDSHTLVVAFTCVCARAHRRLNPNAGLHTHNITHLITQTFTLIHSNNVSHTHTLRGPSVSQEEGTSG